MSDDDPVEREASTYVISPREILEDEPEAVGEGQYIARLAGASIGKPSYAVIPLIDGRPAEKIRVGDDGAVYDRTLIDGIVLYRSGGFNSAGGSGDAR